MTNPCSVAIVFDTVDAPWGGGNQFLRALKGELRRRNGYADNTDDASVVLFNSHHHLERVISIKKRDPNKIVLYRIDGPLCLVRGSHAGLDRMNKLFCDLFVDGLIFQSQWSRQHSKEMFNFAAPHETIIHNTVDSQIFSHDSAKTCDFRNRKIKLVAASWSSNMRKGFETYSFLDTALDFSRFSMTFIGNTPVVFKNIEHIKPVASNDLARRLRDHDIFITASQQDPCSNAVVEALHCGLPVVALNDGGHPELVKDAGVLFEGTSDIVQAIEKVANNYEQYRGSIASESMASVADRYCAFAQDIYEKSQSKNYAPKQLTMKKRMAFFMQRTICTACAMLPKRIWR